ncbi:MAG: hypothetical protein ACOZQL_29615 [Myxococcota bacterium]
MKETAWRVSSLRVSGLAQALARKGVLDEVLLHCTPETRAVFTRPHDAASHPAQALVDFNEAVVRTLGTAGLEELNFEATRDAYSKVLRPIVTVAVAITGASPASILSRVPSSVGQILPGVTATWTARGKNAGTVSIAYPGSISPTFEHAWRGGLRFLSELAGTPLRIDEFRLEGSAFVFDLSW